MKKRIECDLKVIEKNNDVKIIYACESGSRAWGFPSVNSDYDVRFIYAHPTAWYLTIAEKRDVIEIPIDDDLDINGWDIRKALKLLRKSNSPLLEWISSPIKYRDVKPIMTDIAKLAANAFLSESSCHHYLSMAKRVISDFDGGEEVKVKSYLYSLRAILCGKWIVKKLSQPPMRIQELLDEFIPSGAISEFVDEIIDEKSRGDEYLKIKRSIEFEDYLKEQLRILGKTIPKNSNKILIEKFDSVFQEVLSACGS